MHHFFFGITSFFTENLPYYFFAQFQEDFLVHSKLLDLTDLFEIYLQYRTWSQLNSQLVQLVKSRLYNPWI